MCPLAHLCCWCLEAWGPEGRAPALSQTVAESVDTATLTACVASRPGLGVGFPPLPCGLKAGGLNY